MVLLFLAFFPWFIHPGQGSATAQMLSLGAVFWVIGAVWDLAFGLASGAFRWLAAASATDPGRSGTCRGIMYLGLAGLLHLAEVGRTANATSDQFRPAKRLYRANVTCYGTRCGLRVRTHCRLTTAEGHCLGHGLRSRWPSSDEFPVTLLSGSEVERLADD
jgi:hypothetical protein